MKNLKIENIVIGSSSSITKIRDSIKGIAKSDRPVLISGEIGTGKHLVAEQIYAYDKKISNELLEFNCLAVPSRLHEEILFGHVDEQGKEVSGMLEVDRRSYLLIENLENLSNEAQSGILSLINNGSYYPAGGRNPKKADIRIIATTDKNNQEITDGNFVIPKLLEEIKEFQIHIPALRERIDDIPLLVKHYMKVISNELGYKTPVIPPELIRSYYSQDWNGNVLQLISSIRTILVSSDGKGINIDLIPDVKSVETSGLLYDLYQQFKERSQTLKEFRYGIEGTVIKLSLEETNYNAAKVGRNIGLSEAGMRRAMERLGIPTRRQIKKNIIP